MRVLGLEGQTFSLLTVIERAPDRATKTQWKCLCQCGNETLALGTELRNGKRKSCGCLLSRRGSRRHDWKGHGEISAMRWHQFKSGASKRNLTFDLTIEEAWELFLRQDRKCPITGRDIYFGCSNRENPTASLDRIDSRGNYTLDNVQWVHKEYNQAKSRRSDQEMIDLARDIVKTHGME